MKKIGAGDIELPLSSLAGALAGVATGVLSPNHPVWWVALLYVAAMIGLGLHLYHGTWSSIRTLGLTRPSGDPLKRRVAAVLAWAIYLGFSIIPIAVLAGIVR